MEWDCSRETMEMNSMDRTEVSQPCIQEAGRTTKTKTIKRLHIERRESCLDGTEREIRLLLVVEEFRLAVYITFIIMAVVGVVLTKVYVEGDYGATLRDVFGVVSICVFFDYPPSTYVLPSIYSLLLLFVYAYAIVSVFRAWVAKEEGRISHRSFVVYVMGFVYIVLSSIAFTICLTVQPDPKKPYTMRIHTVPYTNFMIALWVLTINITWFGENVAWRKLGLPKFFSFFNWVMVLFQTVAVIGKIIHHINCLGNLEEGLWWNPNKAPEITNILEFVDYLFLATCLGWPTVQSGVLAFKRYKTHCVFISLKDNCDYQESDENIPE